MNLNKGTTRRAKNVHISREIEMRCRVRSADAFRKTLFELPTKPLFKGKYGLVKELNLVYKNARRPETTFRLRRRVFADGTLSYVYTEKGKNESTTFRAKTEQNDSLLAREFFKKLKKMETSLKRSFVYEKRFFAEEYRRHDGLMIELFEFPYLGHFTEFEWTGNNVRAHREGVEERIQSAMRIFHLDRRSCVHESTREMAQMFCRKNKVRYAPVFVFSGADWEFFCRENGLSFVLPIGFSEIIMEREK